MKKIGLTEVSADFLFTYIMIVIFVERSNLGCFSFFVRILSGARSKII